ncbi:MAG: Ryanodine receptor Ryr [Desulfomonile tiedjei]|uniref:Ryanodine receptor Ryr n=1 Tax=Desulfomonile tiedjei TaxID=2358 RepID=A0A9D6V1P2_9BACT|nr:Ryanodine receptor Ryr [Desulfomonile tiedjei]
MNTYTPKPIDTSKVNLTDDLLELTEHLAENTHEIWSKQRMGEGWTWGPERDDKSKKHPDLIPYADLLESEKEYDRMTAMETLKVIVGLGYRVRKS